MAVSVWNKPCTIITIYWRIMFVSGMIMQTSVLFTVEPCVVVMQMPAWMTNVQWDIVHSVHKGSLRLYWWNYQGDEGAFLSWMSYCSACSRLCVTSISSQNQRGMWEVVTSC